MTLVKPEEKESYKNIGKFSSDIGACKLPSDLKGQDAEQFKKQRLAEAEKHLETLRSSGPLGQKQAEYAKVNPNDKASEQEIKDRLAKLQAEGSAHRIRAFSAIFISETLAEYKKADEAGKKKVLTELAKTMMGPSADPKTLLTSKEWTSFSDPAQANTIGQSNQKDIEHLRKFAAFRTFQALGIKVDGGELKAGVTDDAIDTIQKERAEDVSKVALRTEHGIPARIKLLEALQAEVIKAKEDTSKPPVAPAKTPPKSVVTPPPVKPVTPPKETKTDPKPLDAEPQAQRGTLGVTAEFKNGKWVVQQPGTSKLPVGAIIQSIDGHKINTFQDMIQIGAIISADSKKHSIEYLEAGKTRKIDVDTTGKINNPRAIGVTVEARKEGILAAGVQVVSLYRTGPLKSASGNRSLEQNDNVVAFVFNNGAPEGCDNPAQFQALMNKALAGNQPFTIITKKPTEKLTDVQSKFGNYAVTINPKDLLGYQDFDKGNNSFVL